MVWAARLRGSRGFQKIVAIKTLLPSMATDAEFERMFLDEAGLASRIRHPNVVEVLDLGEQNGVLYQVMEWVDGEHLRAIMKQASKTGALIPTGIAVRLIMQACAGLHAAHNLKDESGELLGLVHRDISPQNIMVTRSGVAKVADFGIAKLSKQGSKTDGSIIKGKVAYMAPEQITGDKNLDRRADVFALGTLLYELTTGKHPFRAENEVATASKICTEERTSPEKVVDGYSPALARVVMKAIAKDPNDRYPTANDMLKALDQAIPPRSRVSTDDEVATWFQSLGADNKSPVIAEAARAADEAESTDVDFSETAMLSEMQVFQVDHQTTTDPSLRGFAPPSLPDGASPRSRPLAAAILGGCLALGFVGIVIIVLFMRRSSSVEHAAPSAAPSTAPIAVASATPVVTGSSSAAPIETSASPVPTVAVSAVASASASASAARRPGGKPAGGTKPTGGPHGGGGFASPVTNPGF